MDDASVLSPHEYWLADLAREVPMPIATLHKWQRLGWVHSRKVTVASAAGPSGPTRTNWSASASCVPTSASGPNPVTRRR